MTEEKKNGMAGSRTLVIGLVAVIIVLGLALVALSIGFSGGEVADERVNVLANSKNDCVECHARTSPGIIEQYGHSSMAGANVTCEDCHEVESGYPGSTEHEGTHVLASPTTAMCETCHENEVAQYNASRHSLPAYVAVTGTDVLSEELMAMYQAIPEAGGNESGPAPDRSRNAIYHLEGPDITRFTCEGCHNIGKPAADGSVGECQQCHLRHDFSLEQARKPETCNACHIGPDHPQYEIFMSSPHGIAYSTLGDNYNWDAEAGTLDTGDFQAPTCAICHMSGFGGAGTTHDVGERLTWYLFEPVSSRRPAWQDNAIRMQSVCSECHSNEFVKEFYVDGDKLVLAINEWVEEGKAIYKTAKDAGLTTDAPFDEPIDFVEFDLWHHWGRTAKFGAWMQSPDFSQWHGAYEMLRELAELRHIVDGLFEDAGLGE